MGKYILKRFLALIPIILGVTFIVFFIMNLAPGDPARMILGDMAKPEEVEALREDMGLNDPLIVQYFKYLFNLVRGDMGISYKNGIPVSTEIFARVPSSFKLAAVATFFCIVMALPLGIIAAIKQNTLIDGLSMFVSLLGVSLPVFWLGLLLILLFSLRLGWLPSGGAEGATSIILPAITLGFHSMATIARTTRSSMLEVIRQDYVRTAKAKGVPRRKVITKHALRNALIPTITVAGLQVGTLLGGSVIAETVFSWPGIGRLMISGINSRNTPVVLGCVVLYSVIFTVVNFIVDMLYAFVDPRIKSQYSGSR